MVISHSSVFKVAMSISTNLSRYGSKLDAICRRKRSRTLTKRETNPLLSVRHKYAPTFFLPFHSIYIVVNMYILSTASSYVEKEDGVRNSTPSRIAFGPEDLE